MSTGSRGSFDLKFTREFDASRELVFEQWSNPEYVSSWFAPEGYTVTACDFSPAKGGTWRVTYGSESETYTEQGEFLEVKRPSRLVFTLTQSGEGMIGAETLVVVSFEETGRGTRMSFHQSGFEGSQRRDDHVVGWGQCFDKLAAGLRTMSDVR